VGANREAPSGVIHPAETVFRKEARRGSLVVTGGAAPLPLTSLFALARTAHHPDCSTTQRSATGRRPPDRLASAFSGLRRAATGTAANDRPTKNFCDVGHPNSLVEVVH
jgi:hypothetical protein